MIDWYPKATKLVQQGDGGSMMGGPSRGVLHTTETSNWAGMKYYHIEYRPGFGFRQYRPFSAAARGLRHPYQTPQTNRQGDVCVQIAVTGYARNSHLWDDKVYDDLAEFIAWCNDQFGIEPVSRFEVGHGGEAYGTGGSARMLWDEWELYPGWCAHQEVPGNTHWDAGRVDWSRLIGDGEVAQFTEDEASELRKMLELLEEKGSSVFFVEGAVDLIRAESKLPLHAPTEDGVDEVARQAVAQVAEEVQVIKETLRSV